MNKEGFTKQIGGLCAAYGKEYSDKLRDIYFEMLKDNSIEDIKVAVKSCMKTSKFFPTIAEIIDVLPGKVTMGDVWQRILECAGDSGRGWSNLTPLEVASVREMGGLSRFQMASEKDLNFMYKEFEKLFPHLEHREHPDIHGEEGLRKLGVLAERMPLLRGEMRDKDVAKIGEGGIKYELNR